MQVFAADTPLPDDARGGVLAIGKFDGVHRGHQNVIAAARAAATARALPLAAATFDPHPRTLFNPDAASFHLQSPAQMQRALAALGAARLFALRFDAALMAMSDRDFAARILVERFGVAHVVVGQNFRFGHERCGSVDSLAALGQSLGFSVEAAPPALIAPGGGWISSTAIRAALAEGDIISATSMLGRPWTIDGVVQEGFRRGRTIGFPTLNVPLGAYQRPRLGVYAVRVDIGDGLWRDGVANIGVNPTTGELPAPLLETHLFHFDEELYGRRIETQLIAFLRPEAKFASLEAMQIQIQQDAQTARALLST